MKTYLTVLFVGLSTLSIQGMWRCGKAKIVPSDVTINERNFQERLALIKRINAELARQDAINARKERANAKYRREIIQLLKGAAERAKAKVDAAQDAKIIALANETLEKSISWHEKRWDLGYLSGFAATKNAKRAIQAKCYALWEEVPDLELPAPDPRAYPKTSSVEASPKEPASC